MSLQFALDNLKATREVRAKSPEDIVSATQRISYIAGTLINLTGNVEMPGGKFITITPKMGAFSPAAYSHQKKVRSLNQGDVLDQANIRFCLMEKCKVLDEIDIDFNEDNPEKFVDFTALLDSSFEEAIGEGMEQGLFRKPEANMEGTTQGAVDYPALSIPTLYCPEHQGVPQIGGAGYGLVVGGMNPTTWTNWRPAGVGTTAAECIRYTRASPFDEKTGVWASLEAVYMRANFMKDLAGVGSHIAAAKAKMIWVTSLLGGDLWRQCCFARGEAYTKTDELTGMYTFHGIPMRTAPIIDELNLDYATNYTSAYGKDNPPFWLLNAKHCWTKFKKGWEWKEGEPLRAGTQQPNVSAVWRQAFFQTFIPDDRRRGGVLVAS